MSWPGLPVMLRLAGRPVVLVGTGEGADAKRRLLERAGAVVVDEDEVSVEPPEVQRLPGEGRGPASGGTRLGPGRRRGGGDARFAVVVDDEAAVHRLKARGLLVNAVDRPELCDFTLPAIVDRAPVLVSVATGGASAGLAAALRQRLEAMLPAGLGPLAEGLHAARDAWRERYPDAGERRRAIADALGEGGALDVLGVGCAPAKAGAQPGSPPSRGHAEEAMTVVITLTSADPDDLTLRQARALAGADRVYHDPAVPTAILDRARADAARIAGAPAGGEPGLTVVVRAS